MQDDDDVAVEEIDEETAVKLFGKEGAAKLFSGEVLDCVYKSQQGRKVEKRQLQHTRAAYSGSVSFPRCFSAAFFHLVSSLFSYDFGFLVTIMLSVIQLSQRERGVPE